MLKLLTFFLLFQSVISTPSIYDIPVKAIDGTSINLSDFAGKKILFVNIATGSEQADQIQKLESLFHTNSGRLIIIACPSNDFGNEPLTNQEIQNSLIQENEIHYLVTEKMNVSPSEHISPLFSWLTISNENGEMSNPVNKDFMKFLIDEEGNLIGVMDSNVDPLDPKVQELFDQK